MRKRLLLTVTMLLAMVVGTMAEEAGTYFKYDPAAHHESTDIYVAFQDQGGLRTDYAQSILGAFIGGECRGEAVAQYDGTTNHYYYQLRVWGEASEAGAAIAFRLLIPDNVIAPPNVNDPTGSGGGDDDLSGLEYYIDSDEPLATFLGEDRVTEPSNPLLVTFVPGMLGAMGDVTVHRDQTVDLLTLVERYPEGSTLPVLSWNTSTDNNEYIVISGNNITGLAITPLDGVEVYCIINKVQYGPLRVHVDAPATGFTWNSEYATGVTIPVGGGSLLSDILTSGYTLVPSDATTRFYEYAWQSSDEDMLVFDPTVGEWNAKLPGVVTLTGEPSDDCGLRPQLRVNIVQPVTYIALSESFIAVEVGDDLTDRLNSLVSIYPDNATNKEVTWEITDDGTSVVAAGGSPAVEWRNGRIVATAVTESQHYAVLTVRALDGHGAQASVYVEVVPQQPKEVQPIRDVLYYTYPGGTFEAIDVTDDLKANLRLVPATLSIDDYEVMYLFEDDEDNTEMEVIGSQMGEQGETRWMLVAHGKTTVTAIVAFYDRLNGGALENVECQFRVEVKEGLGRIEVDEVLMTKGETKTMTLQPQPATVEYDPDLISVRLMTAAEGQGVGLPEEWDFVTLQKVDALHYEVSAKSIGVANVVVSYDGQPMGWGEVVVQQRLEMADGWQWIALQQGQVEGEEMMHDAFGDHLSDLRSADEVMVNDTQLGYIGTLHYMEPGQTYKLRLKNLGAETLTYDVRGYDYVYRMFEWPVQEGDEPEPTERDMELRKGWNWVGNPYQYYQSLNDIFADGSQFSENDVVKSKEQFATYNGTAWVGALTHLTPGEGILIYLHNAGEVHFKSEFTMQQNHTQPLSARRVHVGPEPWTFDHRQFEDNMAMVAYVNGVNDPSRVTLWAFVGDECRGRSETVGDRQFITVHGRMGERVSFRVYDELTGHFHEVYGTRPMTAMLGTVGQPVSLYAGQVLAISDATRLVNSERVNSVYDLQGRKIVTSPNGQVKSGVYIQGGKKVVR